ncbi:MAG: hypothetical protein QXL10_02970 [Candidatus Bathyarchaeia archaeon]
MGLDNKALLEMLDEADFNDVLLFETVAERIFLSNDNETIGIFLNKLRFSFLSNDELYRMRILEKIGKILETLSLEQICSICCDSLVGNFAFLYILFVRVPIIKMDLAKRVANMISMLNNLQDVVFFGFPYQERILLQIDERVASLSQEELNKCAFSFQFLFQIGVLKKSRDTVVSFLNIYKAIQKKEYALKSALIESLLHGDRSQASLILEKFGDLRISSDDEIIKNYFELWKYLEKMRLPVYFDISNLRFNGVVFNDNFYFLLYKTLEGNEKVVFPFCQVPISEVNKIYDPKAKIYYTPKEKYGRLVLDDVFSFREIRKIETPSSEAITAVAFMSENEIEAKIRHILRDANKTGHSPVEIADIFTQNLYVNNIDDLRFSAFIIKGPSFSCVHLNDIGGQILKACHSYAKIIFLVYVTRIDDNAQSYFIKECESKQKNYCIVDRNNLARLFMAYEIL